MMVFTRIQCKSFSRKANAVDGNFREEKRVAFVLEIAKMLSRYGAM
jgi:hypothetical protein